MEVEIKEEVTPPPPKREDITFCEGVDYCCGCIFCTLPLLAVGGLIIYITLVIPIQSMG